jgi:hypothetical protein
VQAVLIVLPGCPSRIDGVEDDVRDLLFDPHAAHALVLAHRPPAASAVAAVVSDAVWSDVVRLLRWAAADAQGDPGRETGTWWRLAIGCAELLRRLPRLGDEVAEPYLAPDLPESDDGPPAQRIAAAAAALTALLRDPAPVRLTALAPRIDALGAAATGALAERAFG